MGGSELGMYGCQKAGVMMKIGQNDGGGDMGRGGSMIIIHTQKSPPQGRGT